MRCKLCHKDFKPVTRPFGEKVFCSRYCKDRHYWLHITPEQRLKYNYHYKRDRKLISCVKCGYTPAVGHHIIPKAFGGSNSKNNMVALCPNHHAELHALYKTAKDNYNELLKNFVKT